VPVVERQRQPEHPPEHRLSEVGPHPLRGRCRQVGHQVPDQRPQPDQPDPGPHGHRRQPRRPELVERRQGPLSARRPIALSTASFNGRGRARSSRVSTSVSPEARVRSPGRVAGRPAGTGCGGRRRGAGAGSSEPAQASSGPEPGGHHRRQDEHRHNHHRGAGIDGGGGVGGSGGRSRGGVGGSGGGRGDGEGGVDSRRRPACRFATLPTGGAAAGAAVTACSSSEPWSSPDPLPARPVSSPDPVPPEPWRPGPGEWVARAAAAVGASRAARVKAARMVRRVRTGWVLSRSCRSGHELAIVGLGGFVTVARWTSPSS
jgi:hypothetical protein